MITQGDANYDDSKVVEEEKEYVEKNYTDDQVDDELLIQMAREGELVNNEHTKTNMQEGEFQEIKCKKVLSEKIYDDGTVERKCKSINYVSLPKVSTM